MLGLALGFHPPLPSIRTSIRKSPPARKTCAIYFSDPDNKLVQAVAWPSLCSIKTILSTYLTKVSRLPCTFKN